MINLPQPTLDRDAFDSICLRMSLDDAEKLASAYPALFIGAIVFGGDDTEAAPPKPGPAKAREPKAAPTVDKEALTAQVFAYVAHNSGRRGEDIALAVGPTVSRDEAQSFARIVRGILEKFVTDGKMYADGERRGRRYKVAAKAEPEATE